VERGEAKALLPLAEALSQSGDLKAAEHALRRADDQGIGEAAARLGDLLQERGDVQGAEAAYHRAMERDVAVPGLAALLERRGDAEGAMAVYRQGRELSDMQSVFNLGLLHERRREFDDAAEALELVASVADQPLAKAAGEALRRVKRIRSGEEAAAPAATKAGSPDY
jgi:tetratricopeptide (TPR) repeat protein